MVTTYHLDEDGVPWASPEIQAGYEAAVGRFIVTFNRLDNILTDVINISLTKIGRPDLIKECRRQNFWYKTFILDLLKSSSAGAAISCVPVDLMREIAAHRNKIAHGHFDINPFSGEYTVVTGNDKSFDYTVDDLDRHTADANRAWEALRYSEAHFAFDDVKLLPE